MKRPMTWSERTGIVVISVIWPAVMVLQFLYEVVKGAFDGAHFGWLHAKEDAKDIVSSWKALLANEGPWPKNRKSAE